jgi:hypothetical protein
MTRVPRGQLDVQKLRDLLDELVRRLHLRGVSGNIRIIGGAAMALRFPDDPSIRVTADIDAVYELRPEVDEVIAELRQSYLWLAQAVLPAATASSDA